MADWRKVMFCNEITSRLVLRGYKLVRTQRTFFEDMSTFFLHDILRALQILLTVRLSGYV